MACLPGSGLSRAYRWLPAFTLFWALLWVGCAKEYVSHDFYSLHWNRTLEGSGPDALFLPDSREFETGSNIGGSTLNIETVFPPFSLQVYSSSFPATGDTVAAYQVDIHDESAASAYSGPAKAQLIGIPFVEPAPSLYAQLPPDVRSSDPDWKKAVRYRIDWDGKTLFGECHLVRYSHKEHGNFGLHRRDPVRLPRLASLKTALIAIRAN